MIDVNSDISTVDVFRYGPANISRLRRHCVVIACNWRDGACPVELSVVGRFDVTSESLTGTGRSLVFQIMKDVDIRRNGIAERFFTLVERCSALE